MALVPFPGPQSGALRVPPEDDDDVAGKMSFLEHLDELRRRIIYACLGILVGIAAGFAFIDEIFDFVLGPTRSALPPGRTLIYTQPGEAFSLYVYVSLISGAVLAAPFIMYQVWLFIAPGLYSNEKRFAIPFGLPPFALYRALRRLNPSPFLFFLNFGGFAIVGSSPEILVRLRGDTVTIRPIAGTRPRGKTPAEDRRNAEELLADPKERAEHLMLLDLGRNDAGRVSRVGTVKVTEQFIIEYYSHVMHIVSNVTGAIRPEYDALSALVAGFPAGTVSGAPKVRAMEIIDELEPERRGVYAGCIGYFGAGGDMDTCIALRTAVVKDGVVYVQAGGGIVADSDPESEYQESWNKARALMRAAEEAVRYATESANEPGV